MLEIYQENIVALRHYKLSTPKSYLVQIPRRILTVLVEHHAKEFLHFLLKKPQ